MKKMLLILIILWANNVYATESSTKSSKLGPCQIGVFDNCHGSYTFDTGHHYSGEWKKNLRDGYGVFTYPNGNKYKGTWKNNVFHGRGNMVFATGHKYYGRYNDGKRTRGTMAYPDGTKYSGRWKSNRKHGRGYLTINGVKYFGKWKNGVSYGRVAKKLPNGTIIEGKLENNKFVQNLTSKPKNLTSKPKNPTFKTKNLIVHCENRKGWKVFIKHFNGVATIIKPIKNPMKGYNPVAENVKIITDNKIGFWYDPKDINLGLNITPNNFFQGFTQAKFDKRRYDFGISSRTYNLFKKKWENRGSGGSYKCRDISIKQFEANK